MNWFWRIVFVASGVSMYWYIFSQDAETLWDFVIIEWPLLAAAMFGLLIPRIIDEVWDFYKTARHK